MNMRKFFGLDLPVPPDDGGFRAFAIATGCINLAAGICLMILRASGDLPRWSTILLPALQLVGFSMLAWLIFRMVRDRLFYSMLHAADDAGPDAPAVDAPRSSEVS